jgi:hypothetical protein
MLEIKTVALRPRGAVSILKPVTSRGSNKSSGISLSLHSPSRVTHQITSGSSGSLGSLRAGSTSSLPPLAPGTPSNSAHMLSTSPSPLLSPLSTSVGDSPSLVGSHAGSVPSPLGSPHSGAVLRIRNSSKRWGTWKRKREITTAATNSIPSAPSPRIGSMSPQTFMPSMYPVSPLFSPIRIDGNAASSSSSSSSNTAILTSPIRSSNSMQTIAAPPAGALSSMNRRHSVTLADISRIAEMRRLRRDARLASRNSATTPAASATPHANTSSSSTTTTTNLTTPPRASPPSSSSKSSTKIAASKAASMVAPKKSRFTHLKDIEGNKHYKGKSLEVSGPELEDLLAMRKQLELDEELEEAAEEDEESKVERSVSGLNGNGHYERRGSNDKLPRLRIDSSTDGNDDTYPQTPLPRKSQAQEQAEEEQAEEEEFDEMIYSLLSSPLQIGAVIKRTAILPIRSGDDQGLFDDKRSRRRFDTWSLVWQRMGMKLIGDPTTSGWGAWSRDPSDAPPTPISPQRGLPPPAFPDGDTKCVITPSPTPPSTTILSSMSSIPTIPTNNTNNKNGITTSGAGVTTTSSSSSTTPPPSSGSPLTSSGSHLHSILGRRPAALRRTVRFDFNYVPPPVSVMAPSYIASLPPGSPLLAQINATPTAGGSGATSSISTPSSLTTPMTPQLQAPIVSLTSPAPAGFKQRARSIIKTAPPSGRVLETQDEAAARVAQERDHEREVRLKSLADGALLTKINSMGKSHERWFQVQEDDLCWGKATSKGTKKKAGLFNRIKKRVLADVIRVRYGTRWSRRFFRYNEKGLPPWLGFSIIFMDRTLDIVCKSDAEVETWFLGLQSLTPLSGAYLTKGAFLWSRIRMKLRYKAREGGLTDRDVCCRPLSLMFVTYRACVV